MNDPGLDDPIDRAAQGIEKTDSEPKSNADGVDEEPDQFLDPTRWWFASTLIPLIAGTFGPIASVFNICALSSHWRETIPSGIANDVGDMIDVPDPHWLLAINGISLALAIVANLALLMNMARRIPFSIAQPVTIITWYISSFLLIGIVVAANYSPLMMLPAGQNRTLTQAYYYAIWAAGLYFVISSMMVLTIYGAYTGHYDKDFKLTISQRTLMLQTISYLVYLLAGAAIWHRLEGWSFLDAVYWANYTLLTIGLGNLSPSTHAGRGLLFPYAIGGIVILGLVIGSIRTLALERGKRKLSARVAEKRREAVIRQMHKRGGKIKLSLFSKPLKIDSGKSEQDRREQEFAIMRQIQDAADTRRKWVALAISATAGLALWTIGALVFYFTEEVQQWTYFQALYFGFVSILTIGYGDLYPQTNAGKSFYVFWSTLAVPTLTVLISNMGDTVVKFVRDATLWLGEATVLPGESSMRERLKSVFGKDVEDALKNDQGPAEEPPGGAYLGTAEREPGESTRKRRHGAKKGDELEEPERMGRELEGEELDEAEDARRTGDFSSENKHLHRFLLIKEIRHVMRDIGTEPPKKYTYDEWSWFLQLLGESESDPKYHRAPPAGEAKESAKNRDQVGMHGKIVKWSWLGPRSPLMGDTDEPEWVLERLSIKLEEELRIERKEAEERRGQKTNHSGRQEEREREREKAEGRTGKRGGSSDSDTVKGEEGSTTAGGGP